MVLWQWQTKTFISCSGLTGYLLSGCLHGYKSVGGRASWYSGSIAVAIEIHISVKKALLVRVVKAITY